MTPPKGSELGQGTSVDGSEGELHPDLDGWVEKDGPEGPWLKHPMLFDSVDSPDLVAKANRIYEKKIALLEDAHRKGDWHTCVFAYERPYRAERLAEIAAEIDDHTDYWQLVRDVWMDTENAWQCDEEWRELLAAGRPRRDMIMNSAERKQLGQMPEPVPVYRGFKLDGLENGFSWTTDRVTAEMFAGRFADLDASRTPRIAIGNVSRHHVIAYFEERNEHEILVLPDDVSITAIEPLKSAEYGLAP